MKHEIRSAKRVAYDNNVNIDSVEFCVWFLSVLLFARRDQTTL